MPSKTNEETVAEFTKYLHDWAIIEPELSLIIGNVNRILVEKDKQREEAVAEARRDAIKLYDLEISPLVDTRLYPYLEEAKERTLQALNPPRHQVTPNIMNTVNPTQDYLNVSIKEYQELKAQGVLMKVKEIEEAYQQGKEDALTLAAEQLKRLVQ